MQGYVLSKAKLGLAQSMIITNTKQGKVRSSVKKG